MPNQQQIDEGVRIAQAVAEAYGWELLGCGILYEGATFHDPSGYAVETNRYGDRCDFKLPGFALAALGRAIGILPKYDLPPINKFEQR